MLVLCVFVFEFSEGRLIFFCFQDRFEDCFSVVSVFAVRFHSQHLNLVPLQECQPSLEFARFCFSCFAPHLLPVAVLQQFFPPPSAVFLLLLTFVFLLLWPSETIIVFRDDLFSAWPKSSFEPICFISTFFCGSQLGLICFRQLLGNFF